MSSILMSLHLGICENHEITYIDRMLCIWSCSFINHDSSPDDESATSKWQKRRQLRKWKTHFVWLKMHKNYSHVLLWMVRLLGWWQDEDKKEAATELLKYDLTFLEAWCEGINYYDATKADIDHAVGRHSVHSPPIILVLQFFFTSLKLESNFAKNLGARCYYVMFQNLKVVSYWQLKLSERAWKKGVGPLCPNVMLSLLIISASYIAPFPAPVLDWRMHFGRFANEGPFFLGQFSLVRIGLRGFLFFFHLSVSLFA